MDNNTFLFLCPRNGEEIIGAVDQLGRLTMWPTNKAISASKYKACDSWINSVYGRGNGYVAVTSIAHAKHILRKKGVEAFMSPLEG